VCTSSVGTYHGLDPLREEEPIVQGVNRVIWENLAGPLEKDRSCVQTIISPEDRQTCLMVSLNEGPETISPVSIPHLHNLNEGTAVSLILDCDQSKLLVSLTID